jgi:hypothetical protein
VQHGSSYGIYKSDHTYLPYCSLLVWALLFTLGLGLIVHYLVGALLFTIATFLASSNVTLGFNPGQQRINSAIGS